MISFYKIIENFISVEKTNRRLFFYTLVAILLIFILFIFDRGLAVGFLLFYFLSAITFLTLSKFKLADKNIYIIFSVVFLLHLSAVLFLYLIKFQALGGGADFEGYHQNAVEIARRFSHFNFSLQGLFTVHYFPVLIGIIYIFTLPEMIVGQMFVVWLACISAALLYFLSIETGSSKKSSFAVSLICGIYPSYLYFGSVLLKDTVVIPLVLVCLLITIKILKSFTLAKFLLFFVALTGLIHFRFYVGFAIMFSFIICWFLLSAESIKKRFIYGLIMVVILGFSPQILGYGYYGINPLKTFLNKDVITTYREVVYAPPESAPAATVKDNKTELAVKEFKVTDIKPANFKENPSLLLPKKESDGSGSSFLVKAGFDNHFKFVKNYLVSFINSMFGPFPWQLRYKRHLFFLTETIPLYIFLFFALRSVIRKIKKDGAKNFLKLYKFTIPILIFSIIAMAALSLYINNFGIIIRIRMPIYISLLSILALSIKLGNVKIFNFKT